MTETARCLRREGYLAMPWRNGAGTTLEIAREPAGGSFDWRLSLATIAVSGPFSSYAGYVRAVVLVEGPGFELEVAAGPAVTLLTPGTSSVFPGAAQTSCRLMAGPCTDLSLMVREPGRIADLTLLEVGNGQALPPTPGSLQAVFCLQGSVVCMPSAGLRAAASDALMLRTHDTLLQHPEAELPWEIRSASATPARVLILQWRSPAPAA